MADSNEHANSSGPTGPKERKLSDTIPMESVQRLAKIPVVESSLNIATDVYSRVKEASSVLNWTLSTAESTMSRAVEHALPVAERLERPLKRMDTLLCSSLDYVESKMPAVKLPPQQLLETTSNYVESKLQPAFDKAAELKQFGAEKLLLPALTLMALVDRARNMMGQQESCELPSVQPCQVQTMYPLITIIPATPNKLNDSSMLRMDAVTPPPCPPPPPPTPAQELEQMEPLKSLDNDNADIYYSPITRDNEAEGNTENNYPSDLLQSLDTDFIEAQAEMENAAQEILVPMI